MTGTSERAAIYARLSDRRDEHEGNTTHSPAVDRQVKMSTDLIARRGWSLTKTFIDDGISAWSGKQRDGFNDLVAEVSAGRVDVIVAYAPDRLARNLRDYDALYTAAQKTGATMSFVVGGDVNPGDANQGLMSGMSALVAAHESALKSTRIKAANDQARAHGRVHRGKRAFGYAANGVDIVPHEADALREVVRQVIAGGSLRQAARWLNDRGILTAGGKEWTAPVLRTSILRPTLAGYVVHRGAVLPDVEGQQVPIITKAEHAQVKAQLSRPLKTRANNRRGRRPITLGTGLFKCVCGETVIASNDNKRDAYRCRTSVLPRVPDGAHTGRLREPVDALVRDVIVARLDQGDVQRVLAASADDGGETERLQFARDQVRGELDDLADAAATGALTVKQVATISAGLQTKLDDLDQQIAARDTTGVLSTLQGVTSGAEWWDSATLEERRSVIDAFITVTIGKTRPGPGFEPRDILIEWKV